MKAKKPKKVNMVKVGSSQIKYIGFVQGDDILYVHFKSNGLYRYRNVNEKIYDLLIDAEFCNRESENHEVSIGSLFHFLIRIHPALYPYEKVEATS